MAIDKPIVVVVHATSKQGTSVVNSLLQTDSFTVKAITRKPGSDKAKRLAAKGAQVVEADALDPASLRAAFEGAYGVFATLPLHGGGGFEDGYKLELDQGKLQADAAAAVGVKVFQWSFLEDAAKRTQGKWDVPHFSAKAHVADYIREKHAGMISIFPSVAAFYTNFLEYARPKKGEDGVLTFAMAIRGVARFPWINPMTATGPVVAAAFLEPEKYRDTVIAIYDEILSCDQMVETFTEVTGIKARFQELTKEDMMAQGLPEPMATMQREMYNYIDEFGYYAPERDMKLAHSINPHPETWADFLRRSGFDGSQSLDDIRDKFGH